MEPTENPPKVQCKFCNYKATGTSAGESAAPQPVPSTSRACNTGVCFACGRQTEVPPTAPVASNVPNKYSGRITRSMSKASRLGLDKSNVQKRKQVKREQLCQRLKRNLQLSNLPQDLLSQLIARRSEKNKYVVAWLNAQSNIFEAQDLGEENEDTEMDFYPSLWNEIESYQSGSTSSTSTKNVEE